MNTPQIHYLHSREKKYQYTKIEDEDPLESSGTVDYSKKMLKKRKEAIIRMKSKDKEKVQESTETIQDSVMSKEEFSAFHLTKQRFNSRMSKLQSSGLDQII